MGFFCALKNKIYINSNKALTLYKLFGIIYVRSEMTRSENEEDETMTTAELKAIMQEIIEEGDYEIVGIRTQEQPFEIGEIDHVSKVWVDGEETEDELDGISCSTINYADMHADDYNVRRGCYYGEHIAIICGNRCTYGEDAGEIIINDPIVVRIIK